MGGRVGTPARRIGKVVFAAVALTLVARANADANQVGRWMKVGSDERPAIVYAPAIETETKSAPESPTPSSSAPPAGKPVIMMLHGMCDTPENECNAFHPAATSSGF